MKGTKKSPNQQMSRSLSPLRSSFLDTLQEKERLNIKYPRKLSEKESRSLKETLED